MQVLRLLLFSFTAGLIVIGPGHTAELYGKTKPLELGKSCSGYGAGFRRVPGSNLCVKIGGWARAETSGGNKAINWGALNTNGSAASTLAPRTRGYVTTDVRQETGYGTLRAYFSVGVNHQ